MSVKIYPAAPEKESCADYRVLVNGREVPLQTARVSAYPFNRRWPGHQRQIEQTELCNFVAFAMSGETEITVIPLHPFSAVHIRPRSLPASSTVGADGVITIRLREPACFTVEPYGTRHALHIFADPMPAYDVGGGEVLYFGAGEHDAGTIELHSGQTLFLEEGAVVYATVFAQDAENIRILGRGILDNSKNTEKILFEANVSGNNTDCGNALREHAVTLIGCKNVEIDGIILRNSLLFQVEKHFEYSMIRTEEELGSIRGVRLEGVNFHSLQKPFFLFAGHSASSPCEDVVCQDLCWNGEPVSASFFERQSQKNEFCRNIRLED